MQTCTEDRHFHDNLATILAKRLTRMIRETDLYPPVKQYFEDEGYEVKSEIKNCDVVACKKDNPTVIIELKILFSLKLVLQGIERQKLSDDVYLAVLKPDTPAKRRNWRKQQRENIGLCRRLGLGLLLVDPSSEYSRQIDTLLDPAPYRPRKNTRKQTRLMREFQARSGDPNKAGVSQRKIVTAYRQDALRCATALMSGTILKVSEIRISAGVSRAASILQKNHYGWFERVARGVYRLTEYGETALQHDPDEK